MQDVRDATCTIKVLRDAGYSINENLRRAGYTLSDWAVIRFLRQTSVLMWADTILRFLTQGAVQPTEHWCLCAQCEDHVVVAVQRSQLVSLEINQRTAALYGRAYHRQN